MFCRYVLLVVVLSTSASPQQLSRVKRIVGGSPAQEPPALPSDTDERTPSPSTAPPATTAPPPASTALPPASTAPPPAPTAPSPAPTAPPPAPTAAPTSERPLVLVKDRKAAVVDGIHNPDGSYSFLGIRYAEPPVKRARFLRPRRLKLKGKIDAKRYGPPCPQWYQGRLIGQEDCLYLNVFTPELPKWDGSPPPSHPVLVWIHGGNFQTGSAAQYLPSDIVKKGVVVVTVQYRLGSLGFLSLGRKELPGNVGLFDISLATRWVRDYIRFFGGDPKRIVPSGQGSGASCASFLALHRHMRSNIKGIFAMSGTPVSPFTLDESEIRTANEAAQLDGCSEQKDIKFVRCMQNLPLETIMKGDNGIENNREKRFDFAQKLSNVLVPGPVEEGKDDSRFLPNFLTESPLDSLKKGNFPKIPLLTGITKEETGSGVKGNLLGEITKLLNPSFLQGGLFKDLLKANTGLYVNKTVNPSLSKLFDSGKYLQYFTQVVSGVLSELQQVVQHSTDAFFCLPAFLTSHFWSQKNKAYLYSFEHKGKTKAGKYLQGIPLVSTDEPTNDSDEPSHGDDLAYLFDIRSLEGEPLNNTYELSDSDKKVRDHFTTMVSEFARSGIPKTADGKAMAPFSKDDGNYMAIKEEPTLMKGFRKCSMGLWTGDSNLLSSTECALGEASKIVTDTLGAAGTQLLNTVSSLEGQLDDAVGRIGGVAQNALVQPVTGTLNKATNGGVGSVLGLGGGDSSKNKGGSLLGLGGNQGNKSSPSLLGLGGGNQRNKSSPSLLGLGGGNQGNKASPSLLGLGGGNQGSNPGGGSLLGLGGGGGGSQSNSNSKKKGSLFGIGK